MSEESDDQGQPASPRRRQLAREQGHVARSPELVFAIACAVAGSGLLILGGPLWQRLQLAMRQDMARAAVRVQDPWSLVERASSYAGQLVAWIAPLLLVLVIGSTVGHWLQHGPLWLPAKLTPDLGRLDPARGWLRLTGNLSPVRLLLTGVKLGLFAGTIAYWWQANVGLLARLGHGSWEHTCQLASHLALQLAACLVVALLLSALLDFAYRYRRYEQSLMVSPAEMKEEVQQVRNEGRARRRPVGPPREARESREASSAAWPQDE